MFSLYSFINIHLIILTYILSCLCPQNNHFNGIIALKIAIKTTNKIEAASKRTTYGATEGVCV